MKNTNKQRKPQEICLFLYLSTNTLLISTIYLAEQNVVIFLQVISNH